MHINKYMYKTLICGHEVYQQNVVLHLKNYKNDTFFNVKKEINKANF